MNTYVALLRGINVGTAKAVPMATLAAVFERLGHTGVQTVLRSGNVVFQSVTAADDAATAIEAALLEATGVQSSVLVLSGDAFARVAAANPLGEVATDGAKTFITFLSSPPPAGLVIPSEDELSPEVARVTASAVYQWVPGGSLQSRLGRSFWKQFPTPVTTRNLNTVERLLELVGR